MMKGSGDSILLLEEEEVKRKKEEDVHRLTRGVRCLFEVNQGGV
jgi:hypothetical protein